MKKIISGVLALTFMTPFVLPENHFTESVAEAESTGTKYWRTMEEAEDFYRNNAVNIRTGYNQICTGSEIFIQKDGKAHFINDDSYALIKVKDKTQLQDEFKAEKISDNEYRISTAGMYGDDKFSRLKANSNVLSIDEYQRVSERDFSIDYLVISSIYVDAETIISRYPSFNLTLIEEKPELSDLQANVSETNFKYKFRCDVDYNENLYHEADDIISDFSYSQAAFLCSSEEIENDTGEYYKEYIYSAPDDGIYEGRLKENDVVYEVFNTEKNPVGCDTHISVKCDPGHSTVYGGDFYYNYAGETCYLINRLEYTEIFTFEGKNLDIEEINSKLSGAKIVYEDNQYRLISETLVSKETAAEVLKSYPEIKEMYDIWSWDTTEWNTNQVDVAPYTGSDTDKLSDLNDILEICKDIAPIERTDECYCEESWKNHNSTTVTFSESLSSDKKLTDKQIQAIDKIRNNGAYFALYDVPKVTASETVKKYRTLDYRLGVSFDTDENMWLKFSDLIEVRNSDGSSYVKFAGHKSTDFVTVNSEPEKYDWEKYYYIEGDNPYLTYMDEDGKIIVIPEFSITPEYYLDTESSSLYCADTNEFVCKTERFFVGPCLSKVYYTSSQSWTCTGDFISCSEYEYEKYYDQIQKDMDVVIRGDVNGDSLIDMTDLSELSLCLLGEKNQTDSKIRYAVDTDRNGKTEVADLSLLLQLVSKKRESLGSFSVKPPENDNIYIHINETGHV